MRPFLDLSGTFSHYFHKNATKNSKSKNTFKRRVDAKFSAKWDFLRIIYQIYININRDPVTEEVCESRTSSAQRPKKSNFPVGRNLRAKTFWRKCIGFFSQHLFQKCVICFRDIHKKNVRCSCLATNFYIILAHKTENVFFRLSGNFPYCRETFHTDGKLSRLSGKFPDCPETFQRSTLSSDFSLLPSLAGRASDKCWYC